MLGTRYNKVVKLNGLFGVSAAQTSMCSQFLNVLFGHSSVVYSMFSTQSHYNRSLSRTWTHMMHRSGSLSKLLGWLLYKEARLNNAFRMSNLTVGRGLTGVRGNSCVHSATLQNLV